VRHHAHLGVRQARVGLDPVDQRRAARRRREQPFKDDQGGALFKDGLQGLDRFRVG
jgi:hypothetical protein